MAALLAYTASGWTQVIVALSIFVPVVATAAITILVLRGSKNDPDEQRFRRLAEDRKRLGDINVQLDRLWDLLRQRRAREEFAQNPGDTHERSAETVEKYLQ